MGFVEEYWDGVLRRLQAEVDGFNRLIGHAGERGRENELALARVLRALVPPRYAVGTGLVIDSADAASRQCDVVLFDQADQPRLLAQTTQLLHPVETVRAVIEVKTTLDSRDLADASRKMASVRALRSMHKHRNGSTHPLFLLFAYAADTSPQSVASNLLELPEDRRPDLVCLVTPGVIGGRPDLLSAGKNDVESTDYVVGATLLLDADGAPVPHDPGPGMAAEHAGGSYPITKHGKAFVLGHPARALLLFTDGLLRGLAALDGSAAPMTAFYLSSHTRRIARLTPPDG